MSEYDPIGSGESPFAGDDDLERVRRRFERASRPFLSPWSWLGWALLLPAAALATRPLLRSAGPSGALLLWSGAVLVGGSVELLQIRRGRRLAATSSLARWALRVQGNLSLVALALSLVLLWQGLAWVLPGLWLLVLGHSLYLLGGLAAPPLRSAGLVFQAGGVAALWPGVDALAVLALATFAGSSWAAWGIYRRR